MKMQDLMMGLKDKHQIDAEKIGEIEGDILGSSLFINILLSVGAFLASGMILIAMLSFLWATMDFDEDYLWLHLSIVAAVMIFMGFKIHSHTSIFGLRLATYFMIFGKLALIGLVYERLVAFTSADFIYDNLQIFAPIALILAIINMYVGKIKLEIYVVLFSCIFFVSFFANNDLFWMSSNSRIDSPFSYEFLVTLILWIWAVVMLLKFDKKHLNRLPFYALVAVQLILLNFDFDRFKVGQMMQMDMWSQVIYNLVLLMPSLYLGWKLQQASRYKFGWQYIAAAVVLLFGVVLPVANVYIILFCSFW